MKQAVKNVREAKAVLKEHKDEVIQKYRVSELGIFGSFVRGEQKKEATLTFWWNLMREIYRGYSNS